MIGDWVASETRKPSETLALTTKMGAWPPWVAAFWKFHGQQNSQLSETHLFLLTCLLKLFNLSDRRIGFMWESLAQVGASMIFSCLLDRLGCLGYNVLNETSLKEQEPMWGRVPFWLFIFTNISWSGLKLNHPVQICFFFEWFRVKSFRPPHCPLLNLADHSLRLLKSWENSPKRNLKKMAMPKFLKKRSCFFQYSSRKNTWRCRIWKNLNVCSMSKSERCAST